MNTVEYTSLLKRVEALESSFNKLATAITKLVSVDQVTQLGLLSMTDIADIKTRIDGVEARLNELESAH